MNKPNQPFIAFHPSFVLKLPEGHRFPILKYDLLPKQLIWEGVVTKEDFFAPDKVALTYLEGVHDPEYFLRFINLKLEKQEIRRSGFPQTKELVERELRLAQGTILGALAAFDRGIGFNIAGGTHHAGHNWAEGFCMLNDQAIAARYLLREKGIKRVMIIDLDVHQGNGTADIFKHEDRVFTFSMHGAHNFPFRKEQSDLDIGLEDGTKGKEYLDQLATALNRIIPEFQPEFVFYQSGVDVLKTDKMGRMNLEPEDCRQRDILVFNAIKKYNIPVQVSMGGGYSPEIKDIVNAHCTTYKEGINRLLRP